ncbi:VOC family protein [Aquibium sp. LZ166]|uniref:VOC family protein n=1 Tax=Aquibium pacificus TaxID=3153579 RepID=A0ABV3SEW3_9HYPH
MSNKLIEQVAYVRVGSRNLQKHALFASEVIGLEKSRETDVEVSFRSDIRLRTLGLFDGDPSETSVGIEIPNERSLNEAAEKLAAAGFEVACADHEQCQQLFVRRAIRTRDGSGNRIDLVIAPFHAGRRFFPTRDAGVQGLQGVGLRSTDNDRDVQFWTKILGARIADWAGGITYLNIDSQHHRIALYPSDRNGVLYIAFTVEDLDNLMQSKYFVLDRQIKVVQGPGRQTASNQMFMHFEGPEKNLYSFVTGIDIIDPARHRPRQFGSANDGLCAWGSVSEGVPELGAARR